LGPSYEPFAVNDDPTLPRNELRLPTEMTPQRLDERERLLAVLEGARGRAMPIRADHDVFRRAAGRLVHGAGGRDLFALEREPGSVRDRYGRHRFGQSLLLARRLSEAGVSLIAVHFNYMSRCDGWDTHSRNFDCLRGELLPLLD